LLLLLLLLLIACREMYESLIQQLVPLLAKAAGAVDLLNRSDINWLDGTGSSKQYKAGGCCFRPQSGCRC
jgi:hypothetical protein